MGEGVGNLRRQSDEMRDRHQHVVLGAVNDHEVKLAVNEDPYPWHVHPDSDEFFLVTEGELEIELETGAVWRLGEWDFAIVPAGMRHRTTPSGRAVNLLVEAASAETRFDD